ncbi:MAG: NAD(P)-dependent oxidoreductase, partial [Saprospiraceae bacterium]
YHKAFRGPGNWRESVALLGAGAIGRKVIELLQPFHSSILVFDPFLSDEAAVDLGVEKVTLEEAFARAFVVSNHLADVLETVGLLNRALFERLRSYAVFINTGRGCTVEEAGLQHVLAARPDLTALLDVTHPEPPVEGSPFYSLPNVSLTTHLAGSVNDETVRMADYCLEEFFAWVAGRPLRYAVKREMLATIA